MVEQLVPLRVLMFKEADARAKERAVQLCSDGRDFDLGTGHRCRIEFAQAAPLLQATYLYLNGGEAHSLPTSGQVQDFPGLMEAVHRVCVECCLEPEA